MSKWMLMLTVGIDCDIKVLRVCLVLLLACFLRYVKFLQMRELPRLRKRVLIC